jgi:SAM-dependent MidA family methyltransferase
VFVFGVQSAWRRVTAALYAPSRSDVNQTSRRALPRSAGARGAIRRRKVLMNDAHGAPRGAAPAPLLDLIRARIAAAGGRITFAEYMDLALYEPRYGYYSAGAVALGRGGDFTTSPEVDPAFGACLAEFAARCDAALDHPAAFLLAEHGAGSGRLMVDLLNALRAEHPALWARAQPVIVERSPALRARQREALDAAGHAARVTWADRAAGVGLVFSNELLDAFPVRRFLAGPDGALQEIYVTVDATGALTDVLGPPADAAPAAYFDTVGVRPPPGQRTEINLGAPAWLQAVAGDLERGFILTIDYGDSAVRLYSALRPEGTLLCYSNGRVTDNPYTGPGAQDMTAHVDFTMLERAGAAGGLATVALTRQMEFLVGLGLGERIAALSAARPGGQADFTAALAARARLFRLIDPDGLGRFHVLAQAKGVAPDRWPPVAARY